MTPSSVAAVAIILAVLLFVAWQLHEARKYRARVPALIRAAVALTEEQLVDLTDDQLSSYRNALEYALQYKRGALRGDPELETASDRLRDERIRRIERDDAIGRAEAIARAAADQRNSRRDLGL